MIEFIIQSTTTGVAREISELIQGVEFSTSRIGVGQLKFSMLKENILMDEGSIVSFKRNGKNIFWGYVFSIDEKRREYEVTAYDQIRYLKNKQSYLFKNKKANEVLEIIATEFKLKLGQLSDTGYLIPQQSEPNQSLLDIILKSLDLTLINAGEMFYLWDDFGALRISNVKDSFSTLVIGDESLLTDFSYTRGIDEDTFNQIKLVRENKETGKGDIYQAFDSVNIKKWGILQYYEVVNEKMNDSQIRERLNQLAITKNRVKKNLKIESIGDISIRAGSSIFVQIGSIRLNTRLIVDSCTHKFSGSQHTMSLELKVI